MALAAVSLIMLSALLALGQKTSRADEVSKDFQTARTALEKYQDPFTAIRDGYFSTVACIAFPTAGTLDNMPYPAGAMGVHFLNMQFVGPELDLRHPQILLYEPVADNKLKLAGAEWFVPYGPGVKRPSLFGHAFYGPMMGHWPVMPAQLVHYDLHVWLWKQNPAGMFLPTNAELKCPATGYTFLDKTPQMPLTTH